MAGQLEFVLRQRRTKALSVTQLVRMVRDALEMHLEEYWVVGEISNARLAPSGHLYLTLKDARAAISVVMFRAAAETLRFRITDGAQVLVRGRVGMYEPRGALQFYAEEIEPRGLGALQLAFEQLKQRLAAEGLFETARKRPLPFLPRTIGLVTALSGAALRDMLAIILGRNPNVQILICPARVQGAGAAAEVAQGLAELNHHGGAEVIIVGRGGGSLEDLWAFNEEAVARAIFRSGVPVISAVGHEIDYTIADFVADWRAATPTAAAQMVVPSRAELHQRIDETAATLVGAMQGVLAAQRKDLGRLAPRLRGPLGLVRQSRQRLDETALGLQAALTRGLIERRRMVHELTRRMRAPAHIAREIRIRTARLALHLARSLSVRIQAQRLHTAQLAARLSEARLRAEVNVGRRKLEEQHQRLLEAMGRGLVRQRQRLAQTAGRLDSLSPLRVLERGYAVVSDARSGRVLTDAALVTPGDELEIRLYQGRVLALARGRQT